MKDILVKRRKLRKKCDWYMCMLYHCSDKVVEDYYLILSRYAKKHHKKVSTNRVAYWAIKRNYSKRVLDYFREFGEWPL